MEKKKVLLLGGSGFLGMSFANYLIKEGYEPVILTRSAKENDDKIKYVQWDGKTVDNWASELEDAAAVVNFTGKSVNCIYTKKNKEEIIQSRLNSVKAIDDAIKRMTKRPPVVIQAGSLAIFGDTKKWCYEESPHGSSFSVEVCQKWEDAFFKQDIEGVRKVLFRIGFALGKGGGALEPLLKLTKVGLGGTVGNGRQYISWLHIDDLNAMLHKAIEDASMTGVYNASSTNPVTNREFMKELRTVLHKRWSPPAPKLAVILGAYLFMRTEPSLALTGRRCYPKRLVDEGFTFQHTDLNKTLRALI
ncbi:TIGR01777 family oxidoreductase [Evansella halocellulosilytica]|uniref:TIGR01777 family oxidoreductase n=1 Tax=Evansella halocellulosilytica TaxID=2011013 RepID=UPI000BB7397A|nr:TIGR01777 family oxidoreductase [Evansella halocellulosilytica]